MAHHTTSPADSAREAVAQKRGLVVFILLGIFTLAEYVVAVSLDSIPVLVSLLAVAALAKCWAITQYFMHVYRLWRGEEAHS